MLGFEKKAARRLDLLALGIAFVSNGPVRASASQVADESFGARLDSIHHSIQSGDINLESVPTKASPIDGSHAINMPSEKQLETHAERWSLNFNNGFAQ